MTSVARKEQGGSSRVEGTWIRHLPHWLRAIIIVSSSADIGRFGNADLFNSERGGNEQSGNNDDSDSRDVQSRGSLDVAQRVGQSTQLPSDGRVSGRLHGRTRQGRVLLDRGGQQRGPGRGCQEAQRLLRDLEAEDRLRTRAAGRP